MAFELAEALTVARQMSHELTGKTIRQVELGKVASLIRQGFIRLEPRALANRRIRKVTAEGKWIFVRLDSREVLLLALETGGKILYYENAGDAPAKFHLRIEFTDGSCLVEQITGWGWAKVTAESELAREKYPGVLGVSPLADQFTLECFVGMLAQQPGRAIKALLLDQWSIAGIGTGYLQDILFRARLHPKRKAGGLTAGERSRLYRSIRTTLNEAVQRGGSETEVDLYGRPGRYRKVMGEHARGKPCPNCGTAIEKVSILGSACYICPGCQQETKAA